MRVFLRYMVPRLSDSGFQFLCAACFIMTMVGCQAPAEEFSVPEWTPVLAIPLVDTQFDLEDVMEAVSENTDTLPIESEGGQLAFVYAEALSGTLAEEWLALPDVAESAFVELDEVLAMAINFSPDGQVFPISDTIISEMVVETPPGALVDVIDLAEGQLTFTLTSTLGDEVEGQLTIPNLVDGFGMPWSTVWNAAVLSTGTYTVTEDLAGWRVLPENPNVQDTNLVRALFDVFVINDAGHTAVAGESLAAEFAMEGLVFDRVEGDFGQSEIYLEQGTSTLAIFDDRFTTSGIEIEQATLSVEVENAFGMEVGLDSVDLHAIEDGVVISEFVTDAPGLLIPPASGSAASPSFTTWTLDEENSNITSFFSVEPRQLELSAWVRSNPSGVEPSAPNFVDAEGYVTGRFRAEIPLALKVEQLDFIDTLNVDFDLTETTSELDSASLRIIMHNGFPFGVALHAVFLDPAGDAIDSLGVAPLDLFTKPALGDDGLPVEPAVFVHDIPFDWERANVLTNAERVVVEVWTETSGASDGAFVYLKEDQFLRLELGAKLYPRLEP